MHYIKKRKQEDIVLICQGIVTCCHFVKL